MPNTATEILKTRIRERLTALNLSANGAGSRAGLGKSYVNDILSDKSKNPVPHRFARLARVLECSPDWLMGGEGELGDGLDVKVAKAIERDCRDFSHAVTVARVALALCRESAG